MSEAPERCWVPGSAGDRIVTQTPAERRIIDQQVGGLVKRARDCANGMGSTKTDRGDLGIFDDLADRIEALEAEVARLREAMGPFVALAKDRAVDAAEWRGKDSIHAIMRVDDLRRILSAIEEQEKDDE